MIRRAFVAVLAGLPAGCGSGRTLVNGAGATFPYPLYAKWFEEFHKRHPDIQINYQSIGSGGGIRQLLERTIDFGASDNPMTDRQLRLAKTEILHLPTVLGAVVCSYHLPGIDAELNFTPEALAGIFLGRIKTWNDAELARANPGVTLPSREIVSIHRSDGSGTTFVLTEYLAKVSPHWKNLVGTAAAVSWPTGLGAKGNEGVAGLIKQVPYSFGYLELIYAIQNDIPHGRIRNPSGAFVKADLHTIRAAATISMPDDFRVSITASPNQEAYPIATFTWLLIPRRITDRAKKTAIASFLRWMLEEGQAMVEPLSFGRLPQQVISKELHAVSRLQ